MIEDYRNEIDKIDKELMKLFKERIDVVSKIKEYKISNNLPVLDEKREKELIKKLLDLYGKNDTTKYYEKFILNLLIISKELQNE